jgi:hypothetical protein
MDRSWAAWSAGAAGDRIRLPARRAQGGPRPAVLSINFIGDGLRDALDPRKVL